MSPNFSLAFSMGLLRKRSPYAYVPVQSEKEQ
jgi:hypothetical protein